MRQVHWTELHEGDRVVVDQCGVHLDTYVVEREPDDYPNGLVLYVALPEVDSGGDIEGMWVRRTVPLWVEDTDDADTRNIETDVADAIADLRAVKHVLAGMGYTGPSNIDKVINLLDTGRYEL